MADKTPLERQIQMRWEDAMDDFFSHMCRYGEREGIGTDALTDAISKQIDSDTADCFTDYLEG